jgi:hypothetical protein
LSADVICEFFSFLELLDDDSEGAYRHARPRALEGQTFFKKIQPV